MLLPYGLRYYSTMLYRRLYLSTKIFTTFKTNQAPVHKGHCSVTGRQGSAMRS